MEYSVWKCRYCGSVNNLLRCVSCGSPCEGMTVKPHENKAHIVIDVNSDIIVNGREFAKELCNEMYASPNEDWDVDIINY